MAKKRKVNKTALVREYLEKHPNAGPSEVSQALKAYQIPPGYVSNIKLKLKKSSNGTVGRRRAAATGSANSGENVVAAAAFIQSCGGIAEARQAIEIAQEVARALNK